MVEILVLLSGMEKKQQQQNYIHTYYILTTLHLYKRRKTVHGCEQCNDTFDEHK